MGVAAVSDNSQIERLTVEQGHRGINSGDRSDALRLLTAILNEAVIGAASLQEMGARASVMCRRLVPAVAMVPLSMDELLLSYAWDMMVPSDIAEMDRELVVELVTDSGRALRSARDLGRRVSLLAYAFRPQCAAEVEDVLPTLGSVDAVWAAHPRGTWDDNYMLFDDYRIVAYPPDAVAPLMELAGIDPQGKALLKVWGEPGVRYRIQSSNDLKVWIDRDTVTATAPDGLATWTDTQPTATRYYQAVALP